MPRLNSHPRSIAPSTPPPAPSATHDLGETHETLAHLRRWSHELGDTFRVYLPARDAWTWVVLDPEDARRVLVTHQSNYVKGVGIDRVRLLLGNGLMTSEGELWRAQRRVVQPAFQRRVVETYADLVTRENELTFREWRAAAAAGERVNVTDATSRLTLRIVLKAVFGEDAGRLEPGFMLLASDPRRDARFAYRCRQLLRDVREVLQTRTAGRAETRPDLLQWLVDSRDEATGASMPQQQVLDEVMTLVVAGHETTASSLNWCWWLLARHPEVEARVLAEPPVFGDGSARFADVARRSFLRQVLDETLRLYPPGWLLTRRSLGPDRLGGYELPAGTDVFISPYLLHRNPRHWHCADSFDPAHFDADVAAARHSCAYMPFGAGPRYCIGQNLALYEMMLHLDRALRQFRLWAPDPAQPEVEARINLRSAADIHMQIETR